MDQLVMFPTCRDGTQNILNLLFNSRPSKVADIGPCAPMVEHSIIMAEITTSVPVQTKPSRTVYLWNKSDEQAYKWNAQEFADNFLKNTLEERTVNDNWYLFRDTLNNLVQEHVADYGKILPSMVHSKTTLHTERSLLLESKTTRGTKTLGQIQEGPYRDWERTL